MLDFTIGWRFRVTSRKSEVFLRSGQSKLKRLIFFYSGKAQKKKKFSKLKAIEMLSR